MTSSVFDKHFGRIIHSWQSGIVISTRGYESSQLFEGIGPRLLISQTFNLTERLSSQPKIRENLNQMFLQCIKHWCGIYCLHVFQDSWRFNRMGQNVVINLSMPSDIEEHKSLQTMFLGNNGLSGTIPQQKAVYLKNMLSNGICCALTNITGNVLCACQYSPRIELFAEKFPLQ
ncbi:uncharacterized protein LOC123227520 isoform X8 [Mangifera indica]|uniref:uncharacterized protein LOC123227520 isoform X8 n=1 Tax=Mangifera indica TaxID=29780 RepID=UPI001CFA1705|nr:uncharacterized protein LOC123227520 isoform X8 [Mangifera indica]